MTEIEPVVIAHGGAGAVPDDRCALYVDGVKAAARCAYKVLEDGGSALDAAEAGVLSMENCPTFNAGIGSALTYDEQVEMDAIVIEGTTMKAGAVGAIRNIRNPVKVARLVMEKTPHVLLVGEGANKFAREYGIEEVEPDSLITPYVRERLSKYKQCNKETVYSIYHKIDPEGKDTVGCCVLDRNGQTACATSTGGITAKMPGRVGDTPIIGSGVYADDMIGAISTTGQGEAIMRACLARHIAMGMSSGKDTSKAIEEGLDYMSSRIKGSGGAIAVSSKGDIAAKFSMARMSWAYIKGGKLHYGIEPNEDEVEDY